LILAAPVANSTLAADVRELAERPPLVIHRDPLRDLADALDGRSDLALWATVDLVNIFGRPDLFRDRPAERGRAWITQILQSVLVFIPIFVTWIGLALATAAYQDMIGSPDGAARVAGRSFLQLWQQGFDGHLAAAFTFFWMAVYTVVALAAIIAVTLYSAWWGRRAELGRVSDRQSLLADLVPVLVRAQIAACDQQHASPARFAGELSRAAGRLGTLLDDTLSAQRGLQRVGELAQHLSQQLITAASAVEAATGGLGRSAAASQTVMEQVVRWAEEAGQAGEQLVTETARRVNEQFVASVEGQGKLLSELTERVDGAVAALRHACDLWAGAGPALSETLGQAGRSGAEAIGETYRLAVAAAASSLGREMTGIGANLAERVEDLQAITERYAEQTRLTTTEQGVHLAAVGTAAATIQDIARSAAAGLTTTLAAIQEVTGELRAVTHRLAQLRGNAAVASEVPGSPSPGDSASPLLAATDSHGESP
jgi:hypothetical protein